MNRAQSLPLRTFTVRVAVVPTMIEVHLLGAVVTYEDRKITGYTLTDAKRRAGIS